MSQKIELTPGQAVWVFGWVKARKVLTWGDVLANERLTFEYLHKECNLPAQQLYLLQPEREAWIKMDKVKLDDINFLLTWSTHPIRDMKADLADIAKMNWPADVLKKLGVTYEDLCEIGMTHQTMSLFKLSLHGWSSIGFRRAHASEIPTTDLYRLFRMPWQDVIASLK